MKTAAILGLLHAVVDAASGAVVYDAATWGGFANSERWPWVVTYNVLAFGLQAPIGMVADRLRAHKPMGLAGLAYVFLAVTIGPCLAQAASPWQAEATAVLVGLGNAMFHVGAGAIVLQQSRGRAAGPGVFVAPGAFGLTLGVWLGMEGCYDRWLLPVALAASAVLLAVQRTGAVASVPAPSPIARRVGPAALLACGGLLFLSIAVRSAAGDLLRGSWRDAMPMAVALTLAAVAGKALGGFVADRLGWRVSAVGALLILVPLASNAVSHAPLAILAMFLVQLTMAVTLAAMFTVLPGHPGTSFGLTSLALLVGAVPGFAHAFSQHPPASLLPPLIVLAALMLFFGLREASWKMK